MTPKKRNTLDILKLRKYPMAITLDPANIACPEGNELSGRCSRRGGSDDIVSGLVRRGSPYWSAQ